MRRSFPVNSIALGSGTPHSVGEGGCVVEDEVTDGEEVADSEQVAGGDQLVQEVECVVHDVSPGVVTGSLRGENNPPRRFVVDDGIPCDVCPNCVVREAVWRFLMEGGNSFNRDCALVSWRLRWPSGRS